MSNSPAMMEEGKMRLRASCNACNESKVRCSQRKPTCARCERNETECIYGLSRRTHKDAPPISIPASQRGRHSRHGKTTRPSANNDARMSASASTTSTSTSNTISNTTSHSTLNNTNTNMSTNSNLDSTKHVVTPYNGCGMPDEMTGIHHNNNPNLFNDYMFPTADTPDPMHCNPPMMDFTSMVPIPGSTNMAPGHFSTNSMGSFWALTGDGECNCHIGVTELLATMRSSGVSLDQQMSLDAQLAKLKRCIISSEMSMSCAHGREESEPIHIMAIAMLIGYVIDDFKMLTNEPAPYATVMSTCGSFEPRLSWGVLELEEDDEMDLRHRLYLLSFRKLEKLLTQLTLYLRDLHNTWAGLADPSRHMAFVIACDYTRLWLEKKAEDVKRRFAVPPKDEAND